MDCHHASIKGRRLTLKWAEHDIYSKKASLHMGSDSIRSLLLQTLAALLVVEEQVSSTRAIYLHMLQLPKNRVTLEYVHDHPHVPRECRRVGSTRAISHCHFQHQGVFFHGGLPCLFPNICQCIGQPLQGKSWGLIQGRVFPLVIWGIHLSQIFVPVGIHHSRTKANNSNSEI